MVQGVQENGQENGNDYIVQGIQVNGKEHGTTMLYKVYSVL